MLPTPCYLISDLHLGVAPADTEADFLNFLRHARTRAASLVINGDLFDFWFEWKSVIPRSSFRVLAELTQYREAGIPVIWLAGNHDCWGGDVLREDVGVDFRDGAFEGRIGQWQTRVEHGDGLRDVEDRAYRRLRWVLRHPWSIRAFRWLHPDFASRLATGSSHASRRHRPGDGGRGLRSVAGELLAARADLDLVVFGHSHAAALERLDGGIYANPGSWLDDPRYVVIEEERIAMHRWTGSAEDDPIDAIDRRAEKALAQP